MDWKQIIATVAPWIATAISGPLGGLAVEAASDALGLSEKTESALKTAISGVTPEQMMALKNADQAFELKMQELGFTHIERLEALAVQDRQSARDREVKTGDRTPRIIACAVIIGFFSILLVMMFKELPASSKEAALIMLGALGSAFTGVISYYYGSTAGSAKKSELLAQSSPPTKK